MKELYKIAYRYLQAYKKRTLLTIVCISLAVTLLSALVLFQNANADYSKRSEEYSNGDYQIRMHITDESLLNKLINEQDIDEKVAVYDYAVSKDQAGSYILLKNVTQTTNMQGFYIKEGNFPKNENDVLISEQYAKAHKLRIGDSFSLSYGKREENGKPIALNTANLIPKEQYVKEGDLTNLKVTGLYMPQIESSASALTDEMIVFKNKKSTNGTMYVKLKDYIVPQWANIKAKFDYSMIVNSYGESILLHTTKQSPLVVGFYVVIAVILVLLVALLSNVFKISLAEKRKYLGMLKSIGATNKQLTIISLFEAGIYALISLPIGILLSYGMCTLILEKLLNHYQNASYPFSYHIMMNIMQGLGIVLLIILVLCFACLLAVRKYFHISPIALIRNTMNEKRQKVKVYKRSEKLFGIESVLGKRYQYQNKIGRKSVRIGVTLSFVLLFTGTAFLHLLQQAAQPTGQGVSVLFKGVSTKEQLEEYKRIAEECVTASTSKDYQITSDLILNNVTYPSNIIQSEAKILMKDNDNYLANFIGIQTQNNIFQKENEIVFKNEGYIKQANQKTRGFRYFNIIDPNNFHISYEEKAINKKADADLKFTIRTNEIYPFMKEDITESEEKFSFCPNLYVSLDTIGYIIDTFNKSQIKDFSVLNMSFFKGNDVNKIQNKLNEVKDKYPDWIKSVQRTDEGLNNIDLSIYIILIGIMVMVMMVSVMNLLCIIINHTLHEKREHAIIMSLGLEKKQLMKMVFFETSPILMTSYILAIPITLSLQVLGYIYLLNGSAKVEFNIEWGILIFGFVFVVVLIFFIMKIVVYIMKKSNIIESIKMED